MKKKRVISRAARILCLVLLQFMAVTAVVCGVTAISYMNVSQGREGGRVYSLNPMEGEELFEDSYAFQGIMESDLSDLAVLTVVRKQMEGENGQYDGEKRIDISAYTNRRNPSYESKITAIYELESLLKWYRHQLSYYDKTFSSLDNLIYHFYGNGEYSTGDNMQNYYDTTLVEEKDQTLGVYRKTPNTYSVTINGSASDTPAVEVEEGSWDIQYDKRYYRLTDTFNRYGIGYFTEVGEGGEIATYGVQLLESRYPDIRGKNIENIAENWEEYGILYANIQSAILDLGYNYDLYNRLKVVFESENTNIKYYIEVQDEDGIHRYSNDMMDGQDRDEYYKGLGRYVIYKPGDMMYESNTSLQEASLWSIFSNHSYTLNENTKIWFGIDTEYPVNDLYKQASVSYASIQNIWIYLGVGIAAVFVWIFLLIFLSVLAGRTYLMEDEENEGETEIELNWFDHVPTEIALAMGVGIAFIAFYLILALWESGVFSIDMEEKMNWILPAVIFFTLMLSILFSQFWFSLIRRLKKGTLIRNSICCRVWRYIWRKLRSIYGKLRRVVLLFYDNRKIAFRTVMPLLILLCVNLILGAIFYDILIQNRYLYAEEFTILLFLCIPLIGINVLSGYVIFRNNLRRQKIVEGITRIREGEMGYKVDTQNLHGETLILANAVNTIGEGISQAVETSMKDERMKADLITNVSHDIKTPLTSIINYVDLLKREQIQTQPIKGYIEVLDAKSQRLKQLTDDLVEVSKISSGNLTLNMEKINLTELLKQSIGEFSEKFNQKKLMVLENYVDGPHVIQADSRHMWRVVENLFNNIYKYALEGTRVYVDIQRFEEAERQNILISIKNISSQPLNISTDELMERFIRGDSARTTEGSGLGLSIAKSLTEAQGGRFDIIVDGDLFKVILLFTEELEP